MDLVLSVLGGVSVDAVGMLVCAVRPNRNIVSHCCLGAASFIEKFCVLAEDTDGDKKGP